jgi:hypothetical protein
MQLIEQQLKQTRTINLVVDSRDRDLKMYPSLNNYVIELNEPLMDVVSAQIVAGEFPLRSVTVNARCKSILVNNIRYEVPNGWYTREELAEVLSRILSVDVEIKYEKYCFRFPTLTVVSFEQPDSLWPVLGLDSKSYTVPTSGILLSNRKSLEDSIDYAIMSIDNFYTLTSDNNATDNAFVLIDQLGLGTGASYLVQKFFNPPINIQKLKIKFVDYDNEPYLFTKNHHHFVIKFECLKTPYRFAASGLGFI